MTVFDNGTPQDNSNGVLGAIPTPPKTLFSLWPGLLGVAAFRAGCYAIMMALALWAELREAPTLPDVILAHLPYVPWIDRVNYIAWLVLCTPLSLALLVLEPRRWQRYMIVAGLISLARGVCIALTGLGPPPGAHVGNGLAHATVLQAYLELISPFHVFGSSSIHVYLSKDLFFSGHTATTFLLVLYLYSYPRLRLIAIIGHILVVASVLLAHLHYSIDVIGAWAVTYSIFCCFEGRLRRATDPRRSQQLSIATEKFCGDDCSRALRICVRYDAVPSRIERRLSE